MGGFWVGKAETFDLSGFNDRGV